MNKLIQTTNKKNYTKRKKMKSNLSEEQKQVLFEVMKPNSSFIKILAIETLFNVILVIILYPLLQKVGYIVEGIFKNKNVLTRYF